jgi:hypothetical protein
VVFLAFNLQFFREPMCKIVCFEQCVCLESGQRVSQAIILPKYQFAKVLLCQSIIVPKSCFATISFCKSIVLPQNHVAKISFCQSIILPTYHFAKVLFAKIW